MRRIAYIAVLALAVLSLAGVSHASADELPRPADRPIDFARDVFPLLKQHCFHCHGGQDAESGFRLDVRREILGETNGQPLAIPGRSADSAIVKLVAGQAPGRRMPPRDEGDPLTADQIAVLRAWIDQGLKWDEQLLPAPSSRSDHWAFQPVRRSPLPDVPRDAWSATRVDVWIAARQRELGIVPAAPAPAAVRLRRASLDLTGLAPTLDELDEFLADESPDAWSRQIDRLLASPAHGIRWGRHWLDLARWAESEGYESNHPRPYAWRYRDYVIRSFNEDRPYDRFLREQIAGDELPVDAGDPTADDERLVATGFLAGARLSSNEEDQRLQRNAVLVDIVNALGESVLGLTLECAQCHNHKFDPLTQRDYYRLQAYFANGQPGNLVLRDADGWRKFEAAKPPEFDAAVQLKSVIYEQARKRLLEQRRQMLSQATRTALDRPFDQRTAEDHELVRQAEIDLQLLVSQVEKEIQGDDRDLYDALKKKIAAIEKSLPDRPQTWGYYSPLTASTQVDVLPMKGFYPLPYEPKELRAAQAYLLVRGDVHRRGPALEPGVPEVLELAVIPSTRQPTRSQLVDWLVSPHHPLTARVWANRIWQYHFGRGIVASSGDFGALGQRPTHPELLDELASALVEQGWSTKRIHRQILLSQTYQQGSAVTAAQQQLDPDNTAWSRWSPRRLESEAIRDASLLASEQLDRAAGGPGDNEKSSNRRSVYLTMLRDRPPEIQRMFDAPSANETCSRRHVTTVALQPLYLMNHPWTMQMAEAMARRIARTASGQADQVQLAFRVALGRLPDADEQELALQFLVASVDQTSRPAAANAANRSDNSASDDTTAPLPPGLVELCQTIMNLNEFLYID